MFSKLKEKNTYLILYSNTTHNMFFLQYMIKVAWVNSDLFHADSPNFANNNCIEITSMVVKRSGRGAQKHLFILNNSQHISPYLF